LISQPSDPLAWDRFSYTLNNPLRYTDPTGHDTCDEDGNCYNPIRGWYLLAGSSKWNFSNIIRSGYSSWEAQSLTTLYESGGSDAQHGVNYIMTHGVHITVSSGWQEWGGATGAWFDENKNIITLPASQYSTESQPSVYGLSSIIHEAAHLEQGSDLSHSKLGEMIAWQIQIRVRMNLGESLSASDKELLNIQSVEKFSDAVQKENSPYWNRISGPLGNILCIGLCSYPDYPNYCWSGGTCLPSSPWWRRFNFSP
jgi:hypothetical protein